MTAKKDMWYTGQEAGLVAVDQPLSAILLFGYCSLCREHGFLIFSFAHTNMRVDALSNKSIRSERLQF